jgi:hypothetical protein
LLQLETAHKKSPSRFLPASIRFRRSIPNLICSWFFLINLSASSTFQQRVQAHQHRSTRTFQAVKSVRFGTLGNPRLCDAGQRLSLEKIHNIHLAAADGTPETGTTAPADDQDLFGLDGDLYSFTSRRRLP